MSGGQSGHHHPLTSASRLLSVVIDTPVERQIRPGGSPHGVAIGQYGPSGVNGRATTAPRAAYHEPTFRMSQRVVNGYFYMHKPMRFAVRGQRLTFTYWGLYKIK
jgi:hypothetical protein